ncbi:MAG: di-heme oxidoredictase family protein [Thermoanaerobaculia bacterium]
MNAKVPILLIAAGLLVLAAPSSAQLAECDQINIDPADVPGGCIARTLDDQIGTGRGDEFTESSSIYLIKRDPARSVRRGRQLFQRKFTRNEGQGPRVNADSTGDQVANRALGAGLSDSCAGCHGRPRGSAGHGGVVNTRPDSRDAPHLFGLGIVEQLGDEMTADLRAIRQKAIEEAQETGDVTTADLVSKSVYFGYIEAFPNGTVDTSNVEGVDEDLRIKPFFHQGGTISMREFIVGAMKAEMGVETPDPVLCAATDPVNPQKVTSPAGFVFDPSKDSFERPPVCDELADGDGDGVSNELDPALLDHLEFYLLNYFKPGQGPTNKFTDSGRKLMDKIGCTECHRPTLKIESDRRVADVKTVHDPVNGIFNELFATAETRFTVVDDGEEFPKLLPEGEKFTVHNFFSDLKRHDLGPKFHERDFDGNRVTEFVTEPLWGVASTAPYGHDGRSMTLDAVIRRHGGEAQASRDAYVNKLKEEDRMAIRAFLNTLVLFPPDDTASNLNPGDPDAADPQDPANHGSINLGALFQIASEGPE